MSKTTELRLLRRIALAANILNFNPFPLPIDDDKVRGRAYGELCAGLCAARDAGVIPSFTETERRELKRAPAKAIRWSRFKKDTAKNVWRNYRVRVNECACWRPATWLCSTYRKEQPGHPKIRGTCDLCYRKETGATP